MSQDEAKNIARQSFRHFIQTKTENQVEPCWVCGPTYR